MRFPPIEDIPNIETTKVDINKVDQETFSLLRNVRFAITHDRVLRRKAPSLPGMLDSLVNQVMVTHLSIRVLLRYAYRETSYPIVADAASLVREQIEKIFIAVTLLQDPKKWIRQYLRNAWLKSFEEYLLECDEWSGIDRFNDHLNKHYPSLLDSQMRIPNRSKRGYKVVVSKFARRAAEHNWHHPDDQKPAWFKRKGKVGAFVRGYFSFPTPWEAVKSVKNPAYYMFLDRWYREYKYFSDYSHILMNKLVLQHVSQSKDIESARKTRIYGEKIASRVAPTSDIAAVTLCALIIPKLSNNYGTKDEAREVWQRLSECGLFQEHYGTYTLIKY